ncbi:hypothetical protein SteCoe_4579 [Stentor coeruleus]|uniref:Uncharacterized protein n=1 Tax=Stentor coeruleus TaxID=5963 RepID=A0A1R2CUC9_9CILI|nr:hypothetical protein SteCoe_4579 [Stentor coeruleus]
MRAVVWLIFIVVLCIGLGEKPTSDLKGNNPIKSGLPESPNKDKKNKPSKIKITGADNSNTDKTTTKPQTTTEDFNSESIQDDQEDIKNIIENAQVNEASPQISEDEALEQILTEIPTENKDSIDLIENKEVDGNAKEDNPVKVEENDNDDSTKKIEKEKVEDSGSLEADNDKKMEEKEIEVSIDDNSKQANEDKIDFNKSKENTENVVIVEESIPGSVPKNVELAPHTDEIVGELKDKIEDKAIENTIQEPVITFEEPVIAIEETTQGKHEDEHNLNEDSPKIDSENPLSTEGTRNFEDKHVESQSSNCSEVLYNNHSDHFHDVHDHSSSDHHFHDQEAHDHNPHDQEIHDHPHDQKANHFHSHEEINEGNQNNIEDKVNIEENHVHKAYSTEQNNEILPQETIESEQKNLNFTSNSKNIIVTYLILFAETTESYVINLLKITRENEFSRIATFYLFTFIAIWLLLPIKKATDYKITIESDLSTSKTLEKLIDDQYEILKEVIMQKESTPKGESSDAQYLNSILESLERIKDLESNFQVQVIDSHKEIWDAIDARKTPLSPPRHITLSIPFT